MDLANVCYIGPAGERGCNLKILVTGGAGFIGSHLSARLLERHHEVIILDNFLTGNRRNLPDSTGDVSFRLVEADVTDSFDLCVDAIFHLASPASPTGYVEHPLETALANSVGTYNALVLAEKYGAKFLLASTSEVYGDPLEHPQREEYWGNANPVGMRSCYEEGKRFAETLTTIFERSHGLDARIVRIFNCYGPNSDPDDGRLVPNFVKQAINHDPITIYGTGEHTRSICYVSDLVEGLLKAMFTEGTRGRIYNLGSQDEQKVIEYALLIKQLSGSRSPIVHVDPIFEDDPRRRRPDIARAKLELGWTPVVGMEEGLRNTIEWFRALMSHEDR